jgi:hypothetical protein
MAWRAGPPRGGPHGCLPLPARLRPAANHPPMLHAAYRLPAGLDVACFRAAWAATTAAHTLLRARIVLQPHGAVVATTKDPVHP